MVTIDIANIRATLKTNIESAMDGFTVYGHEPKTKAFPSITVSWPDTFDPRATMAGDVDLVVPVLVELVWVGDEQTDADMMTAMGDIVDAIESDRNLDGYCDDLSCGPFQNIGQRSLPDDRAVMQFVVPVEILA